MDDFFEEDNSPKTLAELDLICKCLKDVRDEIDKKKQELEALNKRKEAYEKMLIASLAASGRTSFKSPHGTFSVGQRMTVSLPKDESARHEFFDYLKESGMYNTMITVNSQTLNSWYRSKKEELESNGDFSDFPKIPGLEEPKSIEIISFRKG